TPCASKGLTAIHVFTTLRTSGLASPPRVGRSSATAALPVRRRQHRARGGVRRHPGEGQGGRQQQSRRHIQVDRVERSRPPAASWFQPLLLKLEGTQWSDLQVRLAGARSCTPRVPPWAWS